MDNPQAFPNYFPDRKTGNDGMTLRDYFAGQVLAGANWAQSKASPKEAAKHAYEVADEMLKQREVSNG